MEQEKVDKVIKKTFDYLAEILDEEKREPVPDAEKIKKEMNDPLPEGDWRLEY